MTGMIVFCDSHGVLPEGIGVFAKRWDSEAKVVPAAMIISKRKTGEPDGFQGTRMEHTLARGKLTQKDWNSWSNGRNNIKI